MMTNQKMLIVCPNQTRTYPNGAIHVEDKQAWNKSNRFMYNNSALVMLDLNICHLFIQTNKLKYKPETNKAK